MLIFACFLLGIVSILAKPNGSVDVKVINLSGRAIEFFWVDNVNPTESLIRQTKKPLRNNTDAMIHSYANHKFNVRFAKHVPDTDTNFTKGPADEVVRVYFNEEANRLEIEKVTKFGEGVTLVQDAVKECDKLFPNNPHECIAEKTLAYVEQYSESRDTMLQFRDALATTARNYTCADDSLKTTAPVRSYDFHFLGKSYRTDVLLDVDSAKIWTVKNFVTREECARFESFAAPILERATVAGENGQSVVSSHRKAQQAAYDLNEENIRADQQWPLFDRILSMVNYHARYNLRPEGQEGFTVIQYNPEDEYMPHCDGSCDGKLHRKRGRVATAVLYCKEPERGGATAFTKADIFVRPKVGQAVFFTYKSPDGRMDPEQLTEHTGCPVTAGEKWIATAWLREGVSEDDPSVRYDPEGVPVYSPEFVDSAAVDEEEDEAAAAHRKETIDNEDDVEEESVAATATRRAAASSSCSHSSGTCSKKASEVVDDEDDEDRRSSTSDRDFDEL